VLAVQERRRLYREAISACLRRRLDGVEVLDGVEDGPALLTLAGQCPLAHVVVEADLVPWDVPALASALHDMRPALQVIGLSASSRPSPRPGVVVLPRSATPEQVARLVQPGREWPVPFVLTASDNASKGPLSGQQLRVLALLSLGMTAAEAAARLNLSERAVAKSKAAIFAKLGAQNQSQAVAIGLAAGLLGPSANGR
jgi:DNA-binding NarL/FixJ family response regulator